MYDAVSDRVDPPALLLQETQNVLCRLDMGFDRQRCLMLVSVVVDERRGRLRGADAFDGAPRAALVAGGSVAGVLQVQNLELQGRASAVQHQHSHASPLLDCTESAIRRKPRPAAS